MSSFVYDCQRRRARVVAAGMNLPPGVGILWKICSSRFDTESGSVALGCQRRIVERCFCWPVFTEDYPIVSGERWALHNGCPIILFRWPGFYILNICFHIKNSRGYILRTIKQWQLFIAH